MSDDMSRIINYYITRKSYHYYYNGSTVPTCSTVEDTIRRESEKESGEHTSDDDMPDFINPIPNHDESIESLHNNDTTERRKLTKNRRSRNKYLVGQNWKSSRSQEATGVIWDGKFGEDLRRSIAQHLKETKMSTEPIQGTSGVQRSKRISSRSRSSSESSSKESDYDENQKSNKNMQPVIKKENSPTPNDISSNAESSRCWKKYLRYKKKADDMLQKLSKFNCEMNQSENVDEISGNNRESNANSTSSRRPKSGSSFKDSKRESRGTKRARSQNSPLDYSKPRASGSNDTLIRTNNHYSTSRKYGTHVAASEDGRVQCAQKSLNWDPFQAESSDKIKPCAKALNDFLLNGFLEKLLNNKLLSKKLRDIVSLHKHDNSEVLENAKRNEENLPQISVNNDEIISDHDSDDDLILVERNDPIMDLISSESDTDIEEFSHKLIKRDILQLIAPIIKDGNGKMEQNIGTKGTSIRQEHRRNRIFKERLYELFLMLLKLVFIYRNENKDNIPNLLYLLKLIASIWKKSPIYFYKNISNVDEKEFWVDFSLLQTLIENVIKEEKHVTEENITIKEEKVTEDKENNDLVNYPTSDNNLINDNVIKNEKTNEPIERGVIEKPKNDKEPVILDFIIINDDDPDTEAQEENLEINFNNNPLLHDNDIPTPSECKTETVTKSKFRKRLATRWEPYSHPGEDLQKNEESKDKYY